MCMGNVYGIYDFNFILNMLKYTYMFSTKLYNKLYSIKLKISEYSFDLFSYLFIKIYLSIVLAINIFLWFAAAYINNNLNSEQIALHYNVDFGINLIGSPKKIFIIPILGLIFLFLNLGVLLGLRRNKERFFAAHVLLSGALASNIILLAAVLIVYLINFR